MNHPSPEASPFVATFDGMAHDRRDPNPFLALYLDRSVPIDPVSKAALLKGLSSKVRQFVLPIVRPLARCVIVLNQLLKIFMPRFLTSSRILHHSIYHGLRFFVAPEANYLILRHFWLGSEILQFIRDNAGYPDLPLHPLKPAGLAAVKDDLFLQHDLNLFNFIIELNTRLAHDGRELEARSRLNFDAITDGPIPLEATPDRFLNFIDLETAIEVYTPLYQLFLTDHDFWRATNSLQLDETVGIYCAKLLGDESKLWLVNNRHPLVPLTTLRAGNRLMLHGLSTESLHYLLRQAKRRRATRPRR